MRNYWLALAEERQKQISEADFAQLPSERREEIEWVVETYKDFYTMEEQKNWVDYQGYFCVSY